MSTFVRIFGGCVVLDVRTVFASWKYYINEKNLSCTPPSDGSGDDGEPLVVAPKFIDMSVEMPLGERCRIDASYGRTP